VTKYLLQYYRNYVKLLIRGNTYGYENLFLNISLNYWTKHYISNFLDVFLALNCFYLFLFAFRQEKRHNEHKNSL
jgi:hypothetical protein